MRYDVIVVGAGPGGSTTAREAACRGLSVLLLDKAEFPRDKPCGGALNPRTTRLLPFALDPVVERTIYGMHVSLRQSRSFTRYYPAPISYFTQRQRLDAFLVERAIAAGVTVREGTAIRDLELRARWAIVRAGGETFEARAVVAADGVNGRTARLAGIDVPRWMGVALECNVAAPDRVLLEWENVLGLDLGSISGGYGWLFPKGDHLNLGVGGWKHAGAALRAQLAKLAEYYEIDPSALDELHGYQLPIRRTEAPLAVANLLLVGDAAGLLDPFTGEGIFAAVRSGQAAARSLADFIGGAAPDLSGYADEIGEALLPDLRVAHQLKDLMQVSAAAFFELPRRFPLFWRSMCAVMRGDATYASLKRQLGLLGLGIDAGSWMTRTAPRLRPGRRVTDPLVPAHVTQRSE